MGLDIRAYWLITAVGASGIGLLVIVVRGAFPPRFHRVLTCFGLANLSLALSYFLRLTPDWTGRFLRDVVGWVLTVFCLSLEYLTFSLLKQQKPRLALVYGPPALATAICIGCSYVHRNLSVQMTLLDTLITAMLGVIIWTLVQPEEGSRPLPDLLFTTVYIALMLISLVQVSYGLWIGDFPAEFNYNQPRAIYFMIGATCFEITIFPLFLLMLTERLNRSLTVQAMRDPLTGLYNRRAFEEIACREIAGSMRTRIPFSILMCDLDRFKQVNDKLGHAAGDALLNAAAAGLLNSLRNEDFLCRWGGDEFCALLPRARREEALAVAERMRRNMEEARGSDGADGPRITISIGIVTSNAINPDLASLVAWADEGLYRAKLSGRNRVAVARETGEPTNGTAQAEPAGLE